MPTNGEARAFGNGLLHAIYREEGGDGARIVRVTTRRAAQICTGDEKPTGFDVGMVTRLLQRMSSMTFETYRLRADEELEGTFVIEPRRKAPTRLPKPSSTEAAE